MTPEQLRQIEELYHALHGLPSAERAALLNAAPEEIRAEVESLLESSTQSLPDLALSVASKVRLEFGTMLGSYRLQEQLGEGGMGVVYKAMDTRLNRPVAIKFLSEDIADATARRRFQREAQMASSLNHPHIVTVHDAGEVEGKQYLVTEFVDGGMLKDWSKQNKRSWREIVELLIGVAEGLAAAHAANILHRDVAIGASRRLIDSPWMPVVLGSNLGRSFSKIAPEEMAVRVGFEPTEPAKVQRFSRPPDSTTLAPHRTFYRTVF